MNDLKSPGYERIWIRKREGRWLIAGVVNVGGKWFPYAQASVETFDDVPEAATEVWRLMPHVRRD